MIAFLTFNLGKLNRNFKNSIIFKKRGIFLGKEEKRNFIKKEEIPPKRGLLEALALAPALASALAPALAPLPLPLPVCVSASLPLRLWDSRILVTLLFTPLSISIYSLYIYAVHRCRLSHIAVGPLLAPSSHIVWAVGAALWHIGKRLDPTVRGADEHLFIFFSTYRPTGHRFTYFYFLPPALG